MAENTHLQAFHTQLERAVTPPAIPEWEQLADACSLFTALLLNREFIRFRGGFLTHFQAKFSEKSNFKAEE